MRTVFSALRPFLCAATALAFLPAVATEGGSGRSFSFVHKDDFARYAEGSDASPVWSSDSYGWTVSRGALVWGGAGSGCALVNRSPFGRLVTAEADLVVREAKGAGWKVAGIRVQQDDANYWHLALVESPDGDGRKHFVELTEMLEGNWGAQGQDATRLEPVETTGGDFNWEYGRPYRLRVEMKPGSIKGTVTETDGTVRVSLAFALNDRAVTWGKPGLTAGDFRAEFRRFEGGVGGKVVRGKVKPVVYPRYAAGDGGKGGGKATGFFRVGKKDGRWWMYDPAGNPTFMVAADHANFNVHWCEKLGYAPYNRNVTAKYGSEAKWADSTVGRLHSWGFNAVGVGSSGSVRRRGLAWMEIIGMGTAWARRDPITKQTTWTGFPNVFSPDFPAFCDKEAEHFCARLGNDPWLVGYFIDNELEWHPWTGKGPFADSLAKPAGHSAKEALVRLMKQRHKTIKSFNAAWGTTLTGFSGLSTMVEAPEPRTDRAREDVRAFVRLAAERYFATTTAAIRRHDPNHMVMGCRFAGQAPDILDIAGKYCDVFSVNCYRNLDLETGKMTDGFEEELRGWHERTGKPLIITEWSFPALDAGLPCKHGAGQRVPTQKDKAFAFTAFQKLLFSTPFVVGSNYFMWADEPELGISAIFPEDSNYGLVNVADEPYELLTKAAAALNPNAPAIHSGKVTEVVVEPGPGEGAFIVRNKGAVGGRFRLALWTDGVVAAREGEIEPGGSLEVPPPAGVLARPGAHYLECVAEPLEPMLDRGPAPARASRSIYVAGTPWPAPAKTGPRRRIPILVANPSATEGADLAAEVDVTRVLPADAGNLSLRDSLTGAPVPFQVDRMEGSTELAFMVDRLAPHSARSFLLYLDAAVAPAARPVVEYAMAEGRYAVNNGVLRLSGKTGEGGKCFDRVDLGALELGAFYPLVWQDVGQNMWVAPDMTDKVEAIDGPVRLVLDVTTSRLGAGGKVITTVGGGGVQERAVRRDKAFRAKFRFVVNPREGWFSSRLVWLENADKEPLRAKAYYHYITSNIGGNAGDDEPDGNRWRDKAAGTCYGAIPGSPLVKVYLWKDEGGMEHPDVARDLEIILKPGERYAAPEPVVYVVGCREDEWKKVESRLGMMKRVEVKVLNVESAP